MNVQIQDPQTEPQAEPSTWLDLALYLLSGFGLFLLASIGAGFLFKQVSMLASFTAYLLNVFFLVGTAYLLGVRRRKTSWSKMGFLPVVWRRGWLWVAAVITTISIPLRAAIGVVVVLLLETLFKSGTGGLQARTDILAVGGSFSWVNFGLTLLGAGVLAPISEEIYFRGLLHGWFQARIARFWPRVLISSAIFGLAHADSVAVVIPSLALGLVNAIAYEKSKSLWLPIAIHALNNSIAVVLLYLLIALNQYLPIPQL